MNETSDAAGPPERQRTKMQQSPVVFGAPQIGLSRYGAQK